MLIFFFLILGSNKEGKKESAMMAVASTSAASASESCETQAEPQAETSELEHLGPEFAFPTAGNLY